MGNKHISQMSGEILFVQIAQGMSVHIGQEDVLYVYIYGSTCISNNSKKSWSGISSSVKCVLWNLSFVHIYIMICRMNVMLLHSFIPWSGSQTIYKHIYILSWNLIYSLWLLCNNATTHTIKQTLYIYRNLARWPFFRQSYWPPKPIHICNVYEITINII